MPPSLPLVLVEYRGFAPPTGTSCNVSFASVTSFVVDSPAVALIIRPMRPGFDALSSVIWETSR